MKRLLPAALLSTAAALPAQADTLFFHTFDQDPPGVFKPTPPGSGQPQFYLPNNDPNLVVKPADKWFKTAYLSLTANPKFGYDAIGVTTGLFALPTWKSYIVGWEGMFPLDNGIKESVGFAPTMGHYAALGSVYARDGYLYVDPGNGQQQKFGAYRRGIPHGFIYTLDLGPKANRLRVTFVQDGEMQASPWLTLPAKPPLPTEPNYMTMTIWFPDNQKAGDSSNYFLDKISINGNFPR